MTATLTATSTTADGYRRTRTHPLSPADSRWARRRRRPLRIRADAPGNPAKRCTSSGATSDRPASASTAANGRPVGFCNRVSSSRSTLSRTARSALGCSAISRRSRLSVHTLSPLTHSSPSRCAGVRGLRASACQTNGIGTPDEMAQHALAGIRIRGRITVVRRRVETQERSIPVRTSHPEQSSGEHPQARIQVYSENSVAAILAPSHPRRNRPPSRRMRRKAPPTPALECSAGHCRVSHLRLRRSR
jgi:hypothetical protein